MGVSFQLPFPLPPDPVSPFVADPEFSIESPPELIQLLGTNTIKYHPATFSGPIRPNVNDMLPNSSLTTQLALSWPDPYFCNITSMTYNGAQKQWNGASYQGTVVLVKKGKCSPYTKLLLAVKLGVSAVLVYPDDGCDTSELWTAPSTPQSAATWACGRELYVGQPGDLANIVSSKLVPLLSIAAAPGIALRSVLAPPTNTNTTITSPSTLPLPLPFRVTVSFPGPNTLVLSELYAAGNMTLSMGYPPVIPDSTAALLRPLSRVWSYLVQVNSSTGLPTGALSPLALTSSPDLFDPCRNRIRHVWCERGHIVLLDLLGSGLAGQMTPHIGAFSQLRALHLDHAPAINGSLPQAMSQLQQLQVITANGMHSITNIDVVANLTGLRYLDMSWNMLTSVPPAMWALPNLTYVDLHHNAISSTMLSPLPNPRQWWYIDVSMNSFTGPLPSFRDGKLAYLNAANNRFTGRLETESFDGLPDLCVLDLSWNEMNGQVPTLAGSNQVVTLDLTNNSFQGSQPLSWSFPQLTIARLSRNGITSFNFTASPRLRVLDLGYNEIQTHVGVDLGSVFALSLPPALSYLDLSHNNISGAWSWSFATSSLYGALTWLSVANNHITSIPDNIFQLGPLAVPSVMTYLDVSQNDIHGTLPTTPPGPQLRSVHFHGNPGLVNPSGTLPSWCTISSDPLVVRDDLTRDYDCHPLIGYRGPLLGTFDVTLDPSYYGYRGCSCVHGTYGVAPACTSLPTELVVGVSPLTPTSTFSDASLGDHRLSYGLDTVWSMSSYESEYEYWNATYSAQLLADEETARIRGEGAATYARAISNSTWFHSLLLNEREAIVAAYEASQQTIIQPIPVQRHINEQPVRQIIINIQLLPTFHDFGDYLEIFEGGPDLRGARVLTVRGTDDTPRELQVTVLAPQATLNFRSRDPSGQHFIANYTVVYDCPLSYHVDNQTNTCIQQTSYSIVSLSFVLQYVVYGVVSFSILILLLSMVILLYHHTADIVVAMTKPFMLWLYTGLVMLCAGAIFYTISPNQGEWVCQTRVWMTALPLVMIVSGMFAKAVRARDGCRDTSRDALDGDMPPPPPPFQVLDLTFLALPWVVLEIVLLAVMSSAHLFTPQLILQNDHLMDRCTTQEWYDTWLIIQAVYVAGIMLITMGVALKYREQCLYSSLSHMLSALFSLFALSILLIPLNYYLTSPDALLLSRSVLQCFGSCCVFFAMICPMLVHLYEKQEREHKRPKKSILKQAQTPYHEASSYPDKHAHPRKSRHDAHTPKKPSPSQRHRHHELRDSMNSDDLSVMECHFHESDGTSIAYKADLSQHTSMASPPHPHHPHHPLHQHHRQASDTVTATGTSSNTATGSSQATCTDPARPSCEPSSPPHHADHHSSVMSSSSRRHAHDSAVETLSSSSASELHNGDVHAAAAAAAAPASPAHSRYVSHGPDASHSNSHSQAANPVASASASRGTSDLSNLTVFDVEDADIQEYADHQQQLIQQLKTCVDCLGSTLTMDDSHAIVARMMRLLDTSHEGELELEMDKEKEIEKEMEKEKEKDTERKLEREREREPVPEPVQPTLALTTLEASAQAEPLHHGSSAQRRASPPPSHSHSRSHSHSHSLYSKSQQ